MVSHPKPLFDHELGLVLKKGTWEMHANTGISLGISLGIFFFLRNQHRTWEIHALGAGQRPSAFG